MNREERIDLYRQLYFHELDRREKILARLSIPLAAIVGVMGLLAFMLNDNSPIHGTWRIVFWCLFAGAALSLAVATWLAQNVAWSFTKTCYIAFPSDMEEYLTGLRASYPGDSPQQRVAIDDHFKDYLLGTFGRASTYNCRHNDQLMTRQFHTGIAATLAVFLALAASVPFYLGRLPSGGQTHERTQSTRAATPTAAPSTGAVCAGGSTTPQP